MNKIRLDNKDFYYQVFYKRIKNMYLRIGYDSVLQITCNKSIPQKKIEEFIVKNESKILKSINHLNTRIPLRNTQIMSIFGENHEIEARYNQPKYSYQKTDSKIHIDFKSTEFDFDYVEAIYKELLLKKILELIPDIKSMMNHHINIEGVAYKAQLMKSRFGSCIPKKRIVKLNTILARFDESFTKVILLHELIHLEVHNHQKDFYEYVDKLIPDYKTQKKRLNQLMRKYVI